MNTKVTLTWNGDAAEKLVLQGGFETLKRVVLFFWQQVQDALSIQNEPERVKRKRNTKAGRKGTTYTIWPNPSEPGDPPRSRTAHLQGGVVHEVDQATLTGRVGLLPSVKYGVYLEYGTRKMAARPWLKATFDRVLPALKAFAEEGPAVA